MPTIKRIHVDQHVIKRNAKSPTGPYQPACTVQNRGRSHKAMTVEIEGPSTMHYRPDKPLSCGARVWIETTSTVLVDGDVIA